MRDPEFTNNMSSFIERCVILPSIIGNQFTKEELVSSEDIWGLISSRAGTFARSPMTKNGVRVDPHPKCKDAVPYFEEKFKDAINYSVTSWSWKFKGAGKTSKYNPGTRALNQNLKEQIGVLYQNNSSVDSILKHNMMINAINSYRSGKYPAAKAQLHHEAGGLISGDLAEKTLTGSLAIMKIIVYGAFVFLFPMLLLTGEIAKYKAWITAAFSLALWSPLFSMINMIIDFAYQPATIVSYSSWSTELKKFDSIASTAANLSLMIPFLSFWLTRMGEGGFMHLAGSIMATANSAASGLASEKSSGRREWDNESIRNRNNDNVSSNKHDTSMQYASAAARSMMSDGSTEMIRPDGKVVYFGGAGQNTSVGETKYTEGVGFNMHSEEGIRRETQEMEANTVARSKAFDKMVASESSALYSLSQSMKSDSGFNIDTSTEEGKETANAINEINRLGDTDEYAWRQNAEAKLRANSGLSANIAKFLGGLAGLNLEIGVDGSVGAENSSSQRATSDNDVIGENTTNTKLGIRDSYTKHVSSLESGGVDKNTQNSIRESYQEIERLDETSSINKSNIDSHNKLKNYVESNSGEMSKDMTEEVKDHYQKLYGGGAFGVFQAVSARTEKAQEAFRDLTASKYQAKFNEIKAQGQQIESSNKVEEFANSNKIESNIGSSRDQFARDNNIKTDSSATAEKDFAEKRDRIQGSYQAKSESRATEYDDTRNTIIKEQEARQGQIDQYEKDRIGKGFAAKNIVNRAAKDFWEQSAHNTFVACAELMKSYNHSSTQELYNVLTTSDVGELYNILEETNAAKYFTVDNARAASSIIAVLMSNLKPLQFLPDADPANCFSIKSYTHPINKGNNLWLFLSTDPSSRELTLPLNASILELFISSIRKTRAKANNKIWVVVDELPSLGKLPSLTQLMAEGRKYGTCVLAGLQSTSQLYHHYGDAESSTLIGLFKTKFAFSSDDPRMGELYSKLCGRKTMISQQKNTSFGANEFRDGVSYNERSEQLPLIPYEDFGKLNIEECYVILPEMSTRVDKIKTPEAKIKDKNDWFIELPEELEDSYSTKRPQKKSKKDQLKNAEHNQDVSIEAVDATTAKASKKTNTKSQNKKEDVEQEIGFE